MVKKVIKQLPIYHKYTTKTPAMALRTVISKDGLGVYASSDTLFRGAVFGRDSLEVAEDLIKIRPKLVRNIIRTLASLQGEEYRDDNEEEPGKIVHEYRRIIVDGKPLSDTSLHIFQELSSRWGGSEKTMAYYGSVDATPHFVRVLDKFVEMYGDKILKTNVTLRSGYSISISLVAENALTWLTGQLKNSKSGLVEYCRKNPHGIENQVWKDSREFYVHENGELANHNAPISSIEVQALAYDAFRAGARLFPYKSDEYEELAKQLRRRTIELLWQQDKKYFAVGTDFDKKGNLRVIQTKSANPAEMLESSFFDDLPENERQKYLKAIVREIMGDDFLTDAGIRSRARNEASLIPFWDYHGSYTSWPKETYDIAKGLRRQGFNKLASELDNRLINIVRAVKGYPEFVYVDARGRVLGAASTAHHHGELVLIDSPNRPEKIQAWTVSAVMSILSSKRPLTVPKIPKVKIVKKKVTPREETWERKLEKEVLRHIPIVPRFKSLRELAARYPTYPYKLNESRERT